jgi:hypothetical protein
VVFQLAPRGEETDRASLDGQPRAAVPTLASSKLRREENRANVAPSGVSIGLTGVPGYTYVVQASTNLTTWVSVRTNIAPAVFTDTNVTLLPSIFYRGVYQP